MAITAVGGAVGDSSGGLTGSNSTGMGSSATIPNLSPIRATTGHSTLTTFRVPVCSGAASTIEEVVATLAVDARNTAEELTIFESVRNQTARIVRFFPGFALDRDIVPVKATGGEVIRTVREFLIGMVGHMKHHLGFFIEKRNALGLAALARGSSGRSDSPCLG
jgi:hypothetical protein